MEIKFDNLFLEKEQMRSAGVVLGSYLDELKELVRKKSDERPEASLLLPEDRDVLEDVLKLKSEKVNHSLKYVLVLGIGGSNLGARAVYDSIRGYFDLAKPNVWPKMLFADTTDPAWLMELASFLEKNINKPDEILLISVMKSGKTKETLFNTEFFYGILKRQLGESEARERLVFITGETTELWGFAKDYDIARLAIPISVGGRFSVFSPAGLFPLAVVGFDIRALLEGAHSVLDRCLDHHVLDNMAAVSAIGMFMHHSKGKKIHDTFVFHPELESLGKWYRQLLAESIGKEESVDGRRIHSGITPTVSVGSSDLHSVFQLYMAGPRDKFTTFVHTEKREHYGRPLKDGFLRELSSSVMGKNATDLMAAILGGVKTTYGKNELPFIEVILPGISEYSIGQFMQWKMVEVMLLAKLFNVDAFNQPNVEGYKIETARILAEE